MFIGHMAVGFAGKKLAPKTSLVSLFFASMFLDLLWSFLLLLDVEHVRISPGITAVTPLDRLLKTIQENPGLGFPHRKIIEYLSQQYNYIKKEYKEVNMSRTVKECRLGKNRAREYLDYLESKGLLERREDGYRKWYRIAAS